MPRTRLHQLLRLAQRGISASTEASVPHQLSALVLPPSTQLPPRAAWSLSEQWQTSLLPSHWRQRQAAVLSVRTSARYRAPWSTATQRAFATGQDSDSGAQEPAAGQRQALAQLERRVAMVFTCAKCDTRSVKTFSRRSYDKGLVLVRCPGCQKLHLVADHLGWFGDKGWTIERLRDEAGVQVQTLPGFTAGTAHTAPSGTPTDAELLRPEDWVGWSRVQALLDVSKERDQQQGQGQGQGQGAASSEQQGGETGSSGKSVSGGSGKSVSVGDAMSDDQVWEVGPEDLDLWRKVRHTAQQQDAKTKD